MTNTSILLVSGRLVEKLRSSIPEGEIPNIRDLVRRECSSNPIFSILVCNVNTFY